MPVKQTAPTPAAPKGKQELDPATLKLISKLCQPIAKTAMARKAAMESAEKTTAQLYYEFREAATTNWPKGHKGKDGDPKDRLAARKLAIDILCTVYDIPESSINITGQDKEAYVYPAKYPDDYSKKKLAGKPLPKELAGKEMDYANASDDDKSIAEHPQIKSAARVYQMVSGLLTVAYPADDIASDLVEQVLTEDGCIVSEDRLRKLANANARDIVEKGSHGGTRSAKVWDESAVTQEVEKIAAKAWDGSGILTTYKGKLDLTELGDCFNAVIAKLEAEANKATKAAAKAKAQADATADEE